jgi:hypothetical protein
MHVRHKYDPDEISNMINWLKSTIKRIIDELMSPKSSEDKFHEPIPNNLNSVKGLAYIIERFARNTNCTFSSADIRRFIFEKYNRRVSKHMIIKAMKTELHMSFKR